MLYFLPPVAGVLIGIALLAAGVAAHLPVLVTIGAVGIVFGGYRWLRKRRNGGAAQ
ncbi:MAG TPA: hypothetical protein VN714_14645 [Trebonia sp.]|jgi:threonine/homoserine/homoserine lactone efflux protein|nr:hypothetical protein [Trebonia sp.]